MYGFRKSHRWLQVYAIFMVALLLMNLVGLAIDPRMITGSPAWLKPAKFAFSSALYAGMLAWILSKVTLWPSFLRLMGNLTAIALVAEIGVINLQAWRGTTSHFNFQTNLDSSLFGVMGFFIAVLWIASACIALALFRQRFANPALGWALRLGLLITVIGSASGGLMTRTMPGQTAGIIGSHTVGSPDGGAGVLGTGWSTSHGDLRIGHFVGLHGMQAIPLLYWFLARKRRPRVTTIMTAASVYFSAAVLLEWQALRGQSLLQPDTITLAAWSAWLVLSALAFCVVSVQWRRRLTQSSAIVA